MSFMGNLYYITSTWQLLLPKRGIRLNDNLVAFDNPQTYNKSNIVSIQQYLSALRYQHCSYTHIVIQCTTYNVHCTSTCNFSIQ